MKINQFDPTLDQEDVSSLLDTIRDNWITEGKKTEALQSMLQQYCGVKHAILLPNGTLALFVALKVLGIGQGDEVLVPDFTFVGSATSVVLTGAKPIFVDVNMNDFNIDIDGVEQAMTERTRAIMPVHIYGQTANMKAIMEMAGRHDLKVVEDAAQGMGVTFGKKHVGTFGDIGCISFFADKTITSGEGGAVLLNDDALVEEVMYFKNQGRLQRGSFVHPRIGYNFRLTDLQASLLINQMKRLDSIVEQKHRNEGLYKKYLAGLGEVEFPGDNGLGRRVPFRVNILVPDPKTLINHLEYKGIGSRYFFYPLHMQPCFNSDNSGRAAKLENAHKIFQRGVSLPSSISLTEEEIRYVCHAIRGFYRRG